MKSRKMIILYISAFYFCFVNSFIAKFSSITDITDKNIVKAMSLNSKFSTTINTNSIYDIQSVQAISRSENMFQKIFSKVQKISKNLMKYLITFALSFIFLSTSLNLSNKNSFYSHAAGGSIISGSSKSNNNKLKPQQSSKSKSFSSKSSTNNQKRSNYYNDNKNTGSTLTFDLGSPKSYIKRGPITKVDKIISTITLSIVFLAVILPKINIKKRLAAKFGFWGTSLYQIQMTYLLDYEERLEFYDSMNTIINTYKEDIYDKKLIGMTFQICIILNRLLQKQTLIKGKMKLLKLTDNIYNREIINDKFNKITLLEQTKYDTLTLNSNKYSKTIIKTDDNELSNVIVTIILATSGPILHNKGWIYENNSLLSKIFPSKNIIKPPNYDNFNDFILNLSNYLTKLQTIQNNYENSHEKSEINENTIPKYDINIIWTPNEVRFFIIFQFFTIF